MAWHDGGAGCGCGADGGVVVQRQSKYVFTPLLMRGWAAGRVIFAPMQHCTGGGGGSGPVVVRLEGCRREPGGGRGGGGWRGYTPLSTPMAGTICRFG